MADIEVGMGDDVVIAPYGDNTYEVSDGGILEIGAGLQAGDVGTTIDLEGDAALIVQPQGRGVNLSDVHFSGTGNVIAFEDPADVSAPHSLLGAVPPLDLSKSGFGSTDAIAVAGDDSITAYSYDSATGVLSLQIPGVSSDPREVLLPAGLDPNDFHLASGDGVTAIGYLACFARGTRIATPSGEVPVESLAAGDRVTRHRGGEARVRWIGHRRVRGAAETDAAAQAPIRIAAGALADGVPSRALRVSPNHALYLDGVLVPAGLLADGNAIRREPAATVEYFHVELDAHDVIVADGAPAESYLDTGNRAIFANAPLASLHPAAPAADPDAPGLCAEMVLSGPRLDAIRARLAARADRAEAIPPLAAAV